MSPLRIKPHFGKRPEKLLKGVPISDACKTGNILKKDNTRVYLSNDAQHFRHEVALIGLAEPPARHAERLAREPGHDNVHIRRAGDFEDVAVQRGVREVLSEDTPAVSVLFHLEHGLHAQQPRRQVRDADPAEQRADSGHGVVSPSRSTSSSMRMALRSAFTPARS